MLVRQTLLTAMTMPVHASFRTKLSHSTVAPSTSSAILSTLNLYQHSKHSHTATRVTARNSSVAAIKETNGVTPEKPPEHKWEHAELSKKVKILDTSGERFVDEDKKGEKLRKNSLTKMPTLKTHPNDESKNDEKLPEETLELIKEALAISKELSRYMNGNHDGNNKNAIEKSEIRDNSHNEASASNASSKLLYDSNRNMYFYRRLINANDSKSTFVLTSVTKDEIVFSKIDKPAVRNGT